MEAVAKSATEGPSLEQEKSVPLDDQTEQPDVTSSSSEQEVGAPPLAELDVAAPAAMNDPFEVPDIPLVLHHIASNEAQVVEQQEKVDATQTKSNEVYGSVNSLDLLVKRQRFARLDGYAKKANWSSARPPSLAKVYPHIGAWWNEWAVLQAQFREGPTVPMKIPQMQQAAPP